MAIARVTRPTVVVFGTVESTRELRKKADQSVYGHDVTIRQENGALLAIRVYNRPESPIELPYVGQFYAVETTVEESRDYGTSLNYERPAANALDLIVTGLKNGK